MSNFPARYDVPARELWSHSGIILEKGITYCFKAEGAWFDQGIECDADGYEMREKLPAYKWPLFWLAQPWKLLNTGERWFQLLGKVGDEVFIIGKESEWTATTDGELLCAANDTRGFFCNNHGQLVLTVSKKT